MKKNHVLALAAALFLAGAGCAWTPAPQPPANEQAAPQPEPAPAPVTEDQTYGPSAKSGLIVVDALKPGDAVASPLTVTGKARGNWFFEASFPIQLIDANGKLLATGIAQAQDEWMTTNFVPYKTTLTFGVPETPTGTLVFTKDNPSGLPQHDDHMSLPVRFAAFQ